MTYRHDDNTYTNAHMGEGKAAMVQTQTRDTVALRIRITEVLGTVALGAITGLLIAWVGINAVIGCGETTRTIDGTYIKGECVLVPWVNS